MDIHLETNVHIEKKSELPKWVKPIQIGERVFLFKWTYAGWKQLTKAEETDIKLNYEI